MDKKQKIYFAISLVTIILGLILSVSYRPYIYRNELSDFGFADTIGSLASVIGFCFFVWSFNIYTNKQKNRHIVLATFVYTLLWEPLGLIGIYGTFDWKDIVAGCISGLLTFGVKELIEKNVDYKKIKTDIISTL